MTNEVKQVINGSPTTVISLAATLANGANTYTGLTGLTMTEFDNSSLLYPWAKVVLSVPDTFAAAPTAGLGVELWMCRNAIDGASNTIPVPAASDLKAAESVGFFLVPALDVAYMKEIVISLAGVKKADFFIKNVCGQTLSYSSGAITVKVTPYSYGPT